MKECLIHRDRMLPVRDPSANIPQGSPRSFDLPTSAAGRAATWGDLAMGALLGSASEAYPHTATPGQALAQRVRHRLDHRARAWGACEDAQGRGGGCRVQEMPPPSFMYTERGEVNTREKT